MKEANPGFFFLQNENNNLKSIISDLEKNNHLLNSKLNKQKKISDVLEESKEKLSALFNNAPLSYQSLNVDGCLIEINPAWIRTLGYNREEVIGKRFVDLLHPDWKPHFEKHFLEFKKRGYVSDILFKIKHKDGSDLDISFEGSIGYYPDGSVEKIYCVFQDITNRKKMEQELKASKQKYKLLAEYTHDWEYLISPTGEYLYISPSVERITGYTVEEFKKKPELFFKIIRKDFREEVTSHYKNERNWKDPIFKTEFPIITRSGEEKWIAHHCSLVNDKSDGWVGRRGNNRDITEHVLDQKALRKSEYLLNETQKLSRVGGWEYRISNGQIIWTGETYRIHALPKSPIKDAQDGFKYYHKDDIPTITKAFEECVSKGIPYNLELRFTNAKKKQMWVRTSGRPIYKDGKLHKVVGNIIDITEYKESEEVLCQYEYIVSSSNDMLALLDKQFRYLAVNKAYMEAFKLTREELIGNTVANVFGEEFFNSTIKNNGERCISGDQINYQGWFDFPAKGRCYMETTYYPYYGFNNKIMGFVVNRRNITERHNAIEKLKEKISELDKMNKFFVNRENRMIELKNEINNLLDNQNEHPKYNVPE